MNDSKWAAYGFVLPASLLLLAILGFPAIASLLESLGVLSEGVPSFKYFIRVLGDESFRQAAFNTLIFVVSVVSIHMVLGMGVALILNIRMPMVWLLRVIAILPWTMPDVIGGLIFRFMLDPLQGGVNAVAMQIGWMQQPYQWLGSETSAMFSVIMAEAWRGYPYPMLILLAGLQSIPRDQYEAAAIDGANAWTSFWHVTVPNLKPMIIIAIVLDVIWECRLFGMIYGMTGGGPGDATQNLSLFVYREYFQFFETSYAAAAAVMLAGVLLVVALPYIRSTLKEKA